MLSNTDQKFIIKSLTFWDRLNKREQDLIFSSIVLTHYKQGENIHAGEDDCIGVLLVKGGGLRTYILSEDGKEVTLYRIGEGDLCVLSASCILKSITFDVHIDAEADSDIFLINSAVFQEICSKNIYAENFSYKIITNRFSEVMWAMQQILFMSFDKRLAIFLIDQIAAQETDTVSLTHEMIARHMGSAREVVSRMLKHFENEGIVALSRGGVKVLDKMKLRKLTIS